MKQGHAIEHRTRTTKRVHDGNIVETSVKHIAYHVKQADKVRLERTKRKIRGLERFERLQATENRKVQKALDYEAQKRSNQARKLARMAKR